jgi:hypothetical protein
MIGDLGGPCPVPSCATATVVTVDVMSKRVTIVYFILILLGAVVVHGADDVRTQSVGNIASPDFASVRKRRIRYLSRETVDSHFLRDERSIVC